MLQDLDLAVIVSPATYPSIKEDIVVKDSVSVWFNKTHRFHDFKGPIPFNQIAKEKKSFHLMTASWLLINGSNVCEI